MITETHIGKIVRQKLEEKERSITWLAGKTNCSSSNLCKLLKNKFINHDLLFQICIVLEEDFFSYYSNELKQKHKEKFDTK